MSYQQRYANKVCVITASASGIGKSIATRFAMEGGNVIVSSRNQKHVDDAVEEILKLKPTGTVVGITCHQAKDQDRQKLIDFVVQKYQGIDVLVVNAAVSTHFGLFLDTTEQQMDKMYEVNFKSSFKLVKDAVPHMLNRKGANILFMSSYSAYEAPNLIGFYGITKTMLLAMAKILAKELNEDRIRVNNLAPGVIKTNFSKSLWEGREKQTIEDQNLERLGVVEDVSNAAAFLCSDEASYINGECIAITGKPIARL